MAIPIVDDVDSTSAEVCVEARRTRSEVAAAVASWAPPVDINSFDQARAALASDRMPSNVLAGDWMDAFAFDVDQQPDPLIVSLEATPHPWLAGHAFVRLSVRAETAPMPEDLGNVVLLLDVSPSMLTSPSRSFPALAGAERDERGLYPATSRFDIVREAIGALVKRLPRDTTLSIARYSGATGILLNPTAVRNPSAIQTVLDSLATSSGWFLGGAKDAVDLSKLMRRSCTDNRIVVVTDTNALIAVDPIATTTDIIRKDNVSVSAVSVGTAGPVAGIEELAHAGLGRVTYGWSKDEVEGALWDLIVPHNSVARHLDVAVHFNPETVAWARLVQEERDRLDVDHVLSGFVRTSLWEVALRPVTEGSVMQMTWTADSPIPGEWTKQGSAEITVEALPNVYADASADMRFAAAIGLAANTIVDGPPRGHSWEDLLLLAEAASRPGQPGDDRLSALVRLAATVASGP